MKFAHVLMYLYGFMHLTITFRHFLDKITCKYFKVLVYVVLHILVVKFLHTCDSSQKPNAQNCM